MCWGRAIASIILVAVVVIVVVGLIHIQIYENADFEIISIAVVLIVVVGLIHYIYEITELEIPCAQPYLTHKFTEKSSPSHHVTTP